MKKKGSGFSPGFWVQSEAICLSMRRGARECGLSAVVEVFDGGFVIFGGDDGGGVGAFCGFYYRGYSMMDVEIEGCELGVAVGV